MAKVKIKAKEFVADVRAGLRDSDLKDKYDLSDRQLGKLFEKLLDQGKLGPSDLDDKSHVFEATLELASTCPHCGSLILVETDRCPNCSRKLELHRAPYADNGLASEETSDRQRSKEDGTREDHTVRLDGLEFDLFQAENDPDSTPTKSEPTESEPLSPPKPPVNNLLEEIQDVAEATDLDDLDFELPEEDVLQYDDFENISESAASGLREDSLVLDDLEFDLATYDGDELEAEPVSASDELPEPEFEAVPPGVDPRPSDATAKTVRMEDPEFELILPFAKNSRPTVEAKAKPTVGRAAKYEPAAFSAPEKDLLDSDSLAFEPADNYVDDIPPTVDDLIDMRPVTAEPVPLEEAEPGFNIKRLIGFAAGSTLAAAVILLIAGLFTGMISLPTGFLPNPASLLSAFSLGDHTSDTKRSGVRLRPKTPGPDASVPRRSLPLAESKPMTVERKQKSPAPEPQEQQVAVVTKASGELSVEQPGPDATGDLHVTAKPKPEPSSPPLRVATPIENPPLPVSPDKTPETKVERADGGQLPAVVRAGEVEEVKKLLDAGADVDAQDPQGVTAIMAAVERGSEPMVRLLLDSGADLGLRDKNGATALRLACESGKTQLVKLLVARDESKGAELLLEVSRKGRTDWVRLLLESGAPIDSRDAEGNTGLMLASGNGRLEVVRLLLEKGANVRLRNKKGVNALGWARAPSGKNYVTLPVRREMVRLLKDHSRSRGSISQQSRN